MNSASCRTIRPINLIVGMLLIALTACGASSQAPTFKMNLIITGMRESSSSQTGFKNLVLSTVIDNGGNDWASFGPSGYPATLSTNEGYSADGTGGPFSVVIGGDTHIYLAPGAKEKQHDISFEIGATLHPRSVAVTYKYQSLRTTDVIQNDNYLSGTGTATADLTNLEPNAAFPFAGDTKFESIGKPIAITNGSLTINSASVRGSAFEVSVTFVNDNPANKIEASLDAGLLSTDGASAALWNKTCCGMISLVAGPKQSTTDSFVAKEALYNVGFNPTPVNYLLIASVTFRTETNSFTYARVMKIVKLT
jgi:hypothetical protein